MDTNFKKIKKIPVLIISIFALIYITISISINAQTIPVNSTQNIKVYPGVIGNADNAIKEFIEGTLEYDINKKCDHHGHDHEHDCATHDCGKDKGGCLGNK